MNKTPFCSCGPDGCQLEAAQPAAGNRRARSWKTRFYPLFCSLLSVVNEDFTSGVS